MYKDKRYLGDGVYVKIEDGVVRLTTEAEYEIEDRYELVVEDEIYLKPEVLEAFISYVGKKD